MKNKGQAFWEIALFIFVFLNVMTLVHELGHYFTLKFFGCNADTPQIWFYFGATPFRCSTQDLQPWQWWIVAYGGPLTAFAASTYLWYTFGKDSLWRLAAIVGWLYGTLPNLVWQIQGTDAYFAVSLGFPPALATLIMVSALAYVGYILYKEIAELE